MNNTIKYLGLIAITIILVSCCMASADQPEVYYSHTINDTPIETNNESNGSNVTSFYATEEHHHNT